MWFKFLFGLILLLSSCQHQQMVKALIENSNQTKVSAGEVVSLGRDDDDGKAKKWHIGGGSN